MDEMRIILIIIGLVLLAAIYWMGRRDERRAQEKKVAQQKSSSSAKRLDEIGTYDDVIALENDSVDYDRFYMSETDNEIFFKSPIKKPSSVPSVNHTGVNPSSHSTIVSATDDTMFLSEDEPVPQNIELPAGFEPLLINLTVMAPREMTFEPHYLKQTLDDSGMSYGDMSIYHYYRRPKVDSLPSRGQRLFSIASMVEPGYFDPENVNTYRTPGIILFLQLPGPIDSVLAFEKMHQMGEMLAKRLNGILCDDKHNKITPQSITHIKDEISEYSLKLRTKLAHTVH